ncbi:MAG: glutamate-1-semialdehyde 2,1-aminomutase [Bacteroidales bacterium]|nr:glutamate-1-semialdehyde 2,1-aminomutase [Bacteroidales bacterium]
MNRTQSVEAYREASQYIAGGVNSPVRALRSVGETPLFVRKAAGAMITDVDGNRFTDYCLSWGVFLLGHAHPEVLRAARKAVTAGTSYGIPSLPETQLAQLVHQFFPSMEKLRFVSSGTEAVMSAIRLARGFTQRNMIVKFDGCYHGHADHLLVSAGSGAASLCNASSAGVPDGFTAYTASVPFNDTTAVERLFAAHGNDIAAVIVEPVPANMGVVLPVDGYLQYLRKITQENQALLIFDEVITGFRVAPGGAQQLFGITPDLTTLGKIVGGGFPAAVFGGRADIMALLAPDGPVYQAGTLSGNPVAMAAGAATLRALTPKLYASLEEKNDIICSELSNVVAGKDIRLNHAGGMFTLFFTPSEVCSFEDARKSDLKRFAAFFRHMLAEGIYLPPSQFEACFLSSMHTTDMLHRFVWAVKKFLS